LTRSDSAYEPRALVKARGRHPLSSKKARRLIRGREDKNHQKEQDKQWLEMEECRWDGVQPSNLPDLVGKNKIGQGAKIRKV